MAAAPIIPLVGSDRVSIPGLLRARADRTPGRTALIWEGTRWTFAEVWREAGRFAALLESRGLGGSGRRVATYLANRPEVLWAWFGAQRTGAVYVSLNRQHQGEVLADMVARARVAVLVASADALGTLPDLRTAGVELVVVAGPPGWEAPPGAPAVPFDLSAFDTGPDAAVDPSSVGTLMYTSGSTGRSKGVLLTHNQLTRAAARIAPAFELGPDDVVMAEAPLYHISGQLQDLLAAWTAGAAVALYPGFSASRFLDRARATEATFFSGFGAVVRLLMAQPSSPADRRHRLRLGSIAGIPPELHDAFERRFGVRLIESTYGMTEAEPLTLPVPGVRLPPGAAGVVGPDHDIRIVDDHDRELPVGQAGEIVARGRVPDVVFAGYEGDPDATAAACRGGWYHTGDLGRLDDRGHLYVLGRLRDRIRHKGENVSAAEVEAILVSHPGVRDAAVVGVPSSIGDEDVKAVLVADPGVVLDPAEVVAFAAERMARFMVPRYVEIVDTMPVTELGKLRRELLKEVTPRAWDRHAGREGLHG